MANIKISALTAATAPADADQHAINQGGVSKSITHALMLAEAVKNATFDAQSMLVAVSDNTPVVATFAASTFAGRKATGDVGSMTAAEALTVLGVETGATADQSDAEIKTAYENNADTNEFSDAEQTKLSGIEASADITDITNVLSSLAAGAADVSVNSQKITNLADGVASNDAVNMSQLLAQVNGLDWKDNVDLLSDANSDLTGEESIDGTMTATSRVALTGQTAPAENGIWDTGAGAWTRATDADASAEVTSGMSFNVIGGTVYNKSSWILTTGDPITLDTTALTFTQIPFLNELIGGTGLTKTGNTLNADAASASAAGIIELATDAETVTGTATDRALTPANLASLRGIADNNLVEIDAAAGAPVSAEYARFTANGLEGRTEAQLKADFNLEIGTDVQAFDGDTAKLDVAAEWTGAQNFNETSLTSTAAAVAWDAGANQVATHTLTENTTISAPTNIPAGRFIAIRVIQHASAAKTLAWNAVFKFAGGTTPTMTVTVARGDIYTFWSNGTNLHSVGVIQDITV